MINLYLKKSTGSFTEVFPDFSNSIKLTRENPYFTQSGSYTLDVVLPMSILENKRFFGNLQRFEKRKTSQVFDVKLIADNKCILYGTAHLTEVSPDEVKIQLVGGNSEVKFISDYGDILISDVEYPMDPPTSVGPIISKTTGYAGKLGQYVYVPIFDETNECVKNPMTVGFNAMVPVGDSEEITDFTFHRYKISTIPQLNLMYMIKCIVEYCGYTINTNEFDSAPWNCIYIARVAANIKQSFPSWSIKEFLEQVQYFFNCTFLFDDVNKIVDILSNKTFFNAGTLNYDYNDEYSVEVSEEDERETSSVGSSNIEFDLSDSDAHDYDNVSEDIKNFFGKFVDDSHASMVARYQNGSDYDRKYHIYSCPEGNYCQREEREDRYSDDPVECNGYLQKIDQFGKLERSVDDDKISLKIVPVATRITSDLPIIGYRGVPGSESLVPLKTKAKILSMKNREEEWTWDDLVSSGAFTELEPSEVEAVPGSSGYEYSTSVWDAIEGEDLDDQTEIEDILQVFFVDCQCQKVCANRYLYDERATGVHIGWLPNGFTDWSLKNIYDDGIEDITHTNKWSLGFKKQTGGVSLGDLHDNPYTINTESEYTIKFFPGIIPDIRKIYIFNNKRYVCLKQEYSISKTGLQPEVTGYFYEFGL